MRDVRATISRAVREHLRRRGFAPGEAERLVALKIRHERGELNESPPDERMRFGRYLVEAGWCAEEGETRPRRDEPSLAELLAEIDGLIVRGREARDGGSGA
jgi:hypothetical protein